MFINYGLEVGAVGFAKQHDPNMDRCKTIDVNEGIRKKND